MSEQFDPYYQWLAIPPNEQPPNYYRLLGLCLYESNSDVIANAADRQMSFIRSYQTGTHSNESQKLLNEISQARVTLLDAKRKQQYDQQLQVQFQYGNGVGEVRPMPAPPVPDTSVPGTPIPHNTPLDWITNPSPADNPKISNTPNQTPIPHNTPLDWITNPPRTDNPKISKTPQVQPNSAVGVNARDRKLRRTGKSEQPQQQRFLMIAVVAGGFCVLILFILIMVLSARKLIVDSVKSSDIATTTTESDAINPTSSMIQPIESTKSAGDRMVKTINGVEFAFRGCPAGTFMMGSPEGEKDRDSDEIQHKVTLSKGFWIMETEVTQKQWRTVMGSNPSYFRGNALPVEGVSWDDCQDFCQKAKSLGLPVCLPTEAQWEYACRAGTTGAYAGNLDAMAWYGSNSDDKTHPVGTKKPNAWGLYDMHGNVWEWCSDWKGECTPSNITDPVGSKSGSNCVDRGGGWCSNARLCRSAERSGGAPNYRGSGLGFRCCVVQ